jgi:hypothetical protein
VTVIGIEPERIETGMGVSEAVAKGVGRAVEAARGELGGGPRVFSARTSPSRPIPFT